MRTFARLIASRSVKLPVIWQEPESISSWTDGASHSVPSRTIASWHGLPAFCPSSAISRVTSAKRFFPALVKCMMIS